jgi:hypothetical protein
MDVSYFLIVKLTIFGKSKINKYDLISVLKIKKIGAE